MAKVWDKPITADTDWGGDASTENLPVSGRQVQAWIKSNIKSDAQISQLIVSWLNKNTINSPTFWKGLPIDADTLKWENNTLTVIGSDGETEAVIDEEFLINFLKENGYITKRDYPFVYDAEKKVWLFTGDLITTGAITMFGSIEGFTPSTIMDAVQVDGRTIVKNAAGQLVAIGGGGSGGGLIVDDVNALIEAALVPVQEEIGLKWTEDSDSIYRWNLAFSWGDHSKEGYALKSYVDDELTKYILLDTAQDVKAQHNFKKGLFIDGLPITKVNSNTIFLDANLVIGGAITMFGNNSSTFKAIWENIPFDSTMQWNGSTWSVVGGGGSSINESAVNLLIGEYLTNNNYASEQWVSNQGYAKQSSLDGVDNRLKSVETFFATSDTDNLVNKWSEIVTFLNATEGDTLDNILKTKANQSALDDAVAALTTEIGKKWTQNDVKIANWDSAYGWGNHANAGYAAKTYVDGELAKYVKLATAQTISARHNFSDGLQIGGITIRKSQDGVVYVDGNLVIKGALTMFGTDTTIPSSIWASIPFDSTMKWDGSKWSVTGGGSGSVDDAAVNVLISEYLAKNSYATQDWVQNQGYLTTHQSISHLLSKTDAANTYQPIINSSNKLAYSLISGTPDLSVYFRSSDFTKSNIKSTLGISDWALAATKPTYTAAEVGALSSSGGALSGTITIGAFAAFGVVSGNFYLGSPEYPLLVRHSGTATINGNTIIHSGNIGSYNAGSANKLRFISFDKNSPSLNTLLLGGGIIHNHASIDYWTGKDAPEGMSYGCIAELSARGDGDLSAQLAWDISHRGADSTRFLWWRANDDTGFANAKWHQIAFTDSNVASATKLQTPRTIWGKSFDGTGNIDDVLKINGAEILWSDGKTISSVGTPSFTLNLEGSLVTTSECLAVGRATADAKFHVGGAAKIDSSLFVGNKQSSLHADWLSYSGICATGGGLSGWLAEFGNGTQGVLLGCRGNGADVPSIGTVNATNLSILPDGGNAAIGGTTADAKLHVYGDAIVGGNANNYLKIETDSQKWWIGVGVEDSDDKFVIYNHSNILHPFIIDTYGKVGVNVRTTDALSQALSVVGGIDIYDLNSEYTGVIGLNRKAAVGGLYNSSYAGWQIHNRAGWFEIFAEPTSGSPKTVLSIGSNGDAYFQSHILTKGDVVTDQYLKVNAWSGYGSGTCAMWYNGNTKTLEVNTGVSFSGNTTINGNLLTTGAITMFSQLSMKNVIDYDGLSLAQLAQIKPARFTWKDRRDNRTHVGGIADEVMQILPEVIYQTSDDKLTMDYGSAAFYIGTSLIKPVIDHEKRIADLENENKRKDEIIISLQNQLKQLTA